MSIQDRDYYQKDLAERLKRIPGTAQYDSLGLPIRPAQQRPPPAQQPAPVKRPMSTQIRPPRQMIALVSIWLVAAMLMLLAAPPILAPRCDLGAWQIEPVACWQYSWQALMATPHSYPVTTPDYPFVRIR
jgi:hypothetical protein